MKNCRQSSTHWCLTPYNFDVTLYELLSGTDGEGKRSNPSDTLIIRKDSDLGRLVVDYLSMDQTMQGRLQGYMQALKEIGSSKFSGVSPTLVGSDLSGPPSLLGANSRVPDFFQV